MLTGLQNRGLGVRFPPVLPAFARLGKPSASARRESRRATARCRAEAKRRRTAVAKAVAPKLRSSGGGLAGSGEGGLETSAGCARRDDRDRNQ